jgi:diaminopimelate dehydrogenase
VRRRRLAVVGFGRLGRACAEAIAESHDTELAGVVRGTSSPQTLPSPFTRVPVAGHVRDLAAVEIALVCVPATLVGAVVRDLLQERLPTVECARLEGGALQAHYRTIADAAREHRVAAVVGAGWNPGMLPLLQRAFELLVPKGHTSLTDRPGASLHHTEAARDIAGVAGALATEYRNAEGRLTRYVYVELAKGAKLDEVREALSADPLFAGEETLVFPVDSVVQLEEAGHGILLERRGTASSGAHQNLLLEGRFDVHTFAARVMLDAVRALPSLKAGAHRYSLWA